MHRRTAALIDDHPVFREGLKLLFEFHGGPRVVGEASDARSASHVVSSTKPDVVLLDMVFPETNGISILRQLLDQRPDQRVLVLSMVKDEARVAHALEAGARGYATKDQTAGDLVDAVRTVLEGRLYLGSTLRPDKIEEQRQMLRASGSTPPDLGALTAREREIFHLTVAGDTARAIGEKLRISARTVETHRARILRKFNVHSAAELVRIAARAGVLPMG